MSEALVFKHFPNKGDLYGVILAERSRVPHVLAGLSKLVEQRNDQEVFARIANTILGDQFDPTS